MKYKKLGKAIGDLITNYEDAIHNSGVNKPISYALYQTWKQWNEKEESRKKQFIEVKTMGINIGDKYIIEIGAVAELPDGKKKYFIKPFESLVFDRKGLEQLERFDKSTEKIYNTGYSVGYEDGAKNQNEVQYKKGYDAGRKDGFAYCRDNTELTDELKQEEYNKALEDASELMAYITQDFIDNCYPNDKGYNLYDLNAKYGLGRVLKDYKAYEEKKKVEEEIKVGDEVSNEDVTRTIIVTYIHNNDYFDGIDFDGVVYTNCYRKLWNKTGRHLDEAQ